MMRASGMEARRRCPGSRQISRNFRAVTFHSAVGLAKGFATLVCLRPTDKMKIARRAVTFHRAVGLPKGSPNTFLRGNQPASNQRQADV